MRAALALVCLAAGPAATAQIAESPVPRFLIIPFENSARDARGYWLSEASAVLLADDLNGRGHRAHTREERLDVFERLQVPMASSLSHATVIRLGRLLGATHVVIGSFTLDDTRITARARNITLETGRLEAEISESGALDDLFAVFERLGRRLAPSAAEAPSAAHPPLLAFEHYIKGLIAPSPSVKVSQLEAALKIDAQFDRARLALWQVHHEQGNLQNALVFGTAVPESSSLYSDARFGVALSLIQLRRFDDAFATLRVLADRAPSAAVMNNLGVIQLRRPVTPAAGRATHYFTRAVDLDRDDPDYAFNLGYAYFVEQDAQSAIYWLRETVRRNPADGDAHAVLSAALQATGAKAEAARERELATQLSSAYAEWRKKASADPLPRSLERVKVSRVPTGVRAAVTAITTSGQREQQQLAAFHLDRGRRFFEQGNHLDAAAELRRVIYLSPYEADAHLLLGRMHLRSGETPAAINAFKIAIWSRETAEGQLALAEAYVQAKDTAAARAAAARALALDPALAGARTLLDRLDR